MKGESVIAAAVGAAVVGLLTIANSREQRRHDRDEADRKRAHERTMAIIKKGDRGDDD